MCLVTMPVAARRRGLLRLVVAAVVLLAGLTPATAAKHPPDRSLVLFAYRTTTAAGSLHISVDAPPGENPSFIGSVFATIDAGDVSGLPSGSAAVFGSSTDPEVVAGGQRTALCRDLGVCYASRGMMTAGMGLWVNSAEGRAGINAVWVVVRSPYARYTYEAKGWQVKPVSGSYRWVSGEDSAVVSANAIGSGVEVSDGEALPGGRYGSFGVAVAPCSQPAGPVSLGAGRIRLDGGQHQPVLTCPGMTPAVTSWSDRATTWRTVGVAAGETTLAEARLFVLDRPRTLPVPRNWPWL